MENPEKALKEKNSSLSVILIVINIVLAYIYTNIGHYSEDESIVNMIGLVGIFTLLLGAYALSYRDKTNRLLNWLFGLALLVFLGSVLLWAYAMALGKAYQH